MKSFQERKAEALSDYLNGLDTSPCFREVILALNELSFVYSDFPSCAGHEEKRLRLLLSRVDDFMSETGLSLKMVLEPRTKGNVSDLIDIVKQMCIIDLEELGRFVDSYINGMNAEYELASDDKLLFKVPVLNLKLDLSNSMTKSLKQDLVSIASSYDFVITSNDCSFSIQHPVDKFMHVTREGSDAIYVANKPVVEEYFSRWSAFWGDLQALAETFKRS